ncbi:BON domain-containing protein [Agrobacterium rubi]|uniref:BON domain-containing protein n=1 Tax=Agrobacterium rubi TaxID=28099 RepID=UPI0015732B20|nr:BON domain-containing protein [Agrobacterium rubi]NTF08582.1 BON domain-containing protein [Agrobacterium rubi]NTF20810.1 BON domain-containing protein [Agrobacterium rubi]NTF29710.1 BON domain-containing protein [Agrobacterium rubi]
MFLNSVYDSNSFSFGLGGSASARCAAIEAELCYLPNFPGREITVQSEGRCVLITGYVETEIDFYRALNIAHDIAGADKVIFRVSMAHKATA